MSELRYWQAKVRYASGIGALVWLGLGLDRWGDGRYVRAHLALGRAER